MAKINKHIEIARTTERGLSSMSQVSADAVLAVLKKRYSRVRITVVNNLSDLETLVERRPDLVFLGMNFVRVSPTLGAQSSDKVWLTDYLDEHGIAYTGSGRRAHQIEIDKPLAKKYVADAGLRTSPFYIVKQNQPQTKANPSLAFPLFVKPTNRGGGSGIDSDSVVNNLRQLHSKIQSIANDLQSDSLVEEYLPGREFSVAILKSEHSEGFSVMPIELIAPSDTHGARLLSRRVKSSNTERVVRVTDKATMSAVTTLALDVFHTLGARDYGRIDIRLDKNGTPHFLEANLIPSLISGYGSFPKACLLNMDLDHEPMILSIVRLGLTRSINVTEDILESNVSDSIVVPSFETELEPVTA